MPMRLKPHLRSRLRHELGLDERAREPDDEDDDEMPPRRLSATPAAPVAYAPYRRHAHGYFEGGGGAHFFSPAQRTVLLRSILETPPRAGRRRDPLAACARSRRVRLLSAARPDRVPGAPAIGCGGFEWVNTARPTRRRRRSDVYAAPGPLAGTVPPVRSDQQPKAVARRTRALNVSAARHQRPAEPPPVVQRPRHVDGAGERRRHGDGPAARRPHPCGTCRRRSRGAARSRSPVAGLGPPVDVHAVGDGDGDAVDGSSTSPANLSQIAQPSAVDGDAASTAATRAPSPTGDDHRRAAEPLAEQWAAGAMAPRDDRRDDRADGRRAGLRRGAGGCK